MNIQHNIPGMNNLNIGKGLNTRMAKNLRRLSTGTRIATAADDAAGLAVSERLRNLISEQTRCVTNTEEGVCVAQTADAALNEVSAMMHRAQQLCVQAGNDTYTEEDRAKLTAEVNALYDEMERIFTCSEYNSLKLFNADGYNPIGDDSVVREYTETVVEVIPGDPMEAWGSLDVVQDKKFDLAKDATPASVTMKLDSSVSPGDASTMNGKSFILKKEGNNYPLRITFSSALNASDGYTGTTVMPDGTYYYDFTVSTKDCTTVQDALDHLSDLSQTNYYFVDRGMQLDKATTKLNASNREIRFSFSFGTLEQTINGSSYQTEHAAGKDDNKNIVSSIETAALGQIDGADSTNNATAYTKESTVTVELLPNYSGALSDDDRAVIASNTLYMSGGPNLSFTTTGEDGKIDISGMSAEDIRSAIIAEINSYRDSEGNQVYSAQLNDEGKVVLKRLNCSETQVTTSYVNEGTGKTDVEVPGISVSTSTIPATAEKGEICTVSLPAGLTEGDLPLCISIDGYNYAFYKYVNGQEVSGKDSTSAWGISGDDIYSSIASAIHSRYSPDVTVNVSGSDIIVTGKYATKDLNITVGSGAGTIAVGGKALLEGSYYYLQQKASIPLDLSAAMSSESAAADLNGKGFIFEVSGNRYTFEFVSGGAEKKDPASTAIDISGCTTYNEIAAAMETALKQHASELTVTHSGNGRLTISTPTQYTSYSIADGKVGMDGLFLDKAGEVSQQASGGTNDTQPQTTIDFSKYNGRNFDELYGKGFRITCATCEGEFINVIFCHDAANSGFPSGKITDVDANGNPITFTNFAVELKDMNSGSDIVRSIVDQLKGKLDHFTDVAVGDPTTVLKVMDKRAGNIEKDGSILRAEILSGVYTNCEYEMTYVEHVNPDAYIGPPGSNVTAYYGYCPIYVGSNEGNGNYILVHLPTLSLELLNLDPPRPDLTDPTTISDVIDRLVTAEEVILTARAQIGADQNRLEHAQKNLSNSAEQSTASYSTIKDTDMAEAMTEQAKLSILQNFQQSTLAHIFQNTSSVLELLS